MPRLSTAEAYQVLGLDGPAGDKDEEEIKKAYRKKSLATHPDKNPVRTISRVFLLVSPAVAFKAALVREGYLCFFRGTWSPGLLLCAHLLIRHVLVFSCRNPGGMAWIHRGDFRLWPCPDCLFAGGFRRCCAAELPSSSGDQVYYIIALNPTTASRDQIKSAFHGCNCSNFY